MELELIPAYLKLEDYIQEEHQNQDTWEKTMVEPYWNILSQWAPFPEDYKKPISHLEKNEAKQQLEALKIYPSNTEMPEGIYGTGVWGNYWYCIHNGDGIQGWFIESIIIEGEADAFAESIFGYMKPSWQYGVRKEEEDNIWDIFESIAEICLSPEESGKYIFGCEELGIPKSDGYYFGIKIIREYRKKTQINDMKKILETSSEEIYRYYTNYISLPVIQN